MSKKVIEDDISVTSKGTFTLPVKMRRLLGLSEKGAKLKIRFFIDTNEAVISKPQGFDEIQQLSKKHLKKQRPPLTDVSKFYQNRGERE
jgi:bifunctional DNA-binding transcriptional regulator/antitoxin component of YhaV-PrlF toxin-antitoxin module